MFYSIHQDRPTPIQYSLRSDWLLGLSIITWESDMSQHAHITFSSADKGTIINTSLPDIIVHRHSMYFSLHAYPCIASALKKYGTFIRVYASDHIGYVFCPSLFLKRATKKTLISTTKNTLIFKGIQDKTSALVCHQRFKNIIETIPLTGLRFCREQTQQWSKVAN